jgi:hypothetical protein
MCWEIRISASLISASEIIHEKGIRKVMRITSKKNDSGVLSIKQSKKSCGPKKIHLFPR